MMSLFLPGGGVACVSDADSFAYDASASLRVCSGTRSHVATFIPFFAGELALETEGTLRYSWLDEHDYPSSTCPDSTAGCQIGEHVYSRRPALLHELIHAVTFANGMNQLSFFTEGVAVAYDPFNGASPGPRYRFAPPENERWLDPRDYMAGMLPSEGYDTAGAFVTFLLMRHGPDRFVRMARDLAYDSNVQDVRRQFSLHYDVDLDEEVELFMANGPCEKPGFEVRAYDCDMDLVPWDGSVLSWAASMSCDDNGVAGGIDPGLVANSVRSVTVEVPRAGLHEIKLEADGVAQLTIGRCFGCPWAPQDSVVQAGEALVEDLAAGSHFLRLTAPSDQQHSARVTLVPLDPLGD